MNGKISTSLENGRFILRALFFMLVFALPFGNIELLEMNLYDFLIILFGLIFTIETLIKKRLEAGLVKCLSVVYVVFIFDLLGMLLSSSDVNVQFMLLQHGRLFLGVLLMVITYRYISEDFAWLSIVKNALISASSVIGLIWLLDASNILNAPHIYKLGGRLAIGFEDPNYFAGFLLLPLSFVLGYVFLNSSFFRHLASVLVAILLFVMIAASLSRGAVISAAVPSSLAILLFLRRGYRYIKFKFFALGLIVVMVVIALSSTPQIRQLVFSLTERFNYERIISEVDQNRQTIWRSAIRFIIERPMGAGYGNFKQINPTGLTAHNLLLESLTELGIIGGLVFLTFVIWLFAKLIQGGISNGMDVAIVGSVGSVLLHSMTVSELFNRAFWLTLGLGLGYLELKRRRKP